MAVLVDYPEIWTIVKAERQARAEWDLALRSSEEHSTTEGPRSVFYEALDSYGALVPQPHCPGKTTVVGKRAETSTVSAATKTTGAQQQHCTKAVEPSRKATRAKYDERNNTKCS
ncbi:hypothetical protein Cob_v005515 [Colletotrichum orbiculare MAFF 240422]|uniref:Uncharacterized protein n=1 Tax=Colletotrichum orbiculare (strain 104-T / ATCC 96160 / CBS 514.97 / LARS 414 / MAFF 240422) TaxID=1213857 RepID=A0A484FSI2_COLOR|nr:hypothetical protein Cob_v005515 [Colletotrichum orbiculare MAFF 240422]